MVKAFDSKSNGIFPHRFESCPRRILNFKLNNLLNSPGVRVIRVNDVSIGLLGFYLFIYSFLQTKRVSQNQNYNTPNLNARTVHYTKLHLQA